MAKLDSRGREILDPTPIALPIGLRRPETLQETMASMIRGYFLSAKQAEGYETPEEADDFYDSEMGDDPRSPWELSADQEGRALELLKAESSPGGEPVAPPAGASVPSPEGKPGTESSGTAPKP